MNRSLLVLGGLLFLAIVTSLLRPHAIPRTSGDFPQQVYVWQQAWTAGVRTAVTQLDTKLSPPVLLAAVVHWDPANQPSVTSVPIDLDALAGKPYAVAIRFDTTDPTEPRAADAADVVSRRLATLKAPPAEVQIDFDCPESKLAGYRGWIAAIQTHVAPIPVAITALPSWLDRRAFKSLADQCPYVLQVHSLKRPTDPTGEWPIIDPIAARAAVDTAARLGRPFRVALPTIGYAVAIDRQTNKATVFAENLPTLEPERFTVRPIRTDPAAMAALIREWQTSRPAMMTGVIWYRLPIETDTLNWSPVTFASVRQGQTPAAVVVIEASAKSGLIELALTNTGNADAPLPGKLSLDWTGDAPLASDFVNDYHVLDQSTTSVTLARDESAAGDPTAVLSPGSRIPIGWIRFPKDTEVRGHVIPKASR